MKGSPGAILALAIGAIFLSLGWNGRYAAVWEAIRTGESTSIGSGDSGGKIPGTNPDYDPLDGIPIIGNEKPINDAPTDEQMKRGIASVKVERTGKEWYILFDDLPAVNYGATCPAQMEKAIIKWLSKSNEYLKVGQSTCVDPSKFRTTLSRGGQVVSADDTLNLMPNGVMAVATQPNAIGYFDHA
jgi:hypothetical protein